MEERLEAERATRLVELDLRKARREIARLRGELERQQTRSPSAKAAEALFRYWVAVRGKNSKTTVFGEKRRKALLSALEHYDPEYIARAIDAPPTTSPSETERRALIMVMQEAMKHVDEETAASLRKTYRDALKNVVTYDELELICRDEVQIEKRHALAEHVNAPTMVGPAWCIEFGSKLAPEGPDILSGASVVPRTSDPPNV
jgi:hypothetical protein